MIHRPAAACAAALAVGALAASVESTASTGPNEQIRSLAGRWAGEGRVLPARGSAEAFKCVVTYFPSNDGAAVRQNLRCQSSNYKLDAATELTISGQRVSGRWEDNINALTGSIAGQVTPDGFDIELQGRFFQANMVVVSTKCEQSVTVTPARADYIRELSASLKKC